MVDYASRAASRARRRESTDVASVVRRLDWLLLGSVAALIVYGLWAIADITRHDVTANPHYYVTRQAVYAAIGVVCLVVAVLIDPEVYRTRWRAIFGGTCFVIALVLLTGPIRGSKRWLDLGFFRFQPSEFGKVLFVLALAGFLAERSKRLGEANTTLTAIGLALVPTGLVFLQPDLGTSLVYGAGLAAVLFVAGTKWSHLGAFLGVVAFVALFVLWLGPVMGIHPLRPYQEKRLTGFLDPSSDPSNATYNIVQSKVAVGAGGFHGRGPRNSTQTNLGYTPEHRTDFVFASYAEQRGFIGATILLALYLLVIWRGLRIVAVARDLFSAIVAGGIVFALLFQIFVNVGMTMGIAPITGIPLPFVSVGGSSMIANLAAMGVLLAIHARSRSARPRRR
jgi:rod shape determining protein RodA